MRNSAIQAFFRYGEHVVPGRVGRVAQDLWFSAPPRMAELPVPDGGDPFEVVAQGHVVRGTVWGESDGPVVYLVHGWGGRGSQFGALVEPLLDTGHRVVMFDAPAHGDSDHGPAGPRSTNGVEFARALDAVFCRFGPAEAVVAHSMGTIATYLAIRFGWLGTQRLVLVAPMVQFTGLLDQFQDALGFGPRSRRALERGVTDFVGIPVAEFDARVQSAHVEPLPTLVLTDRGDRQTPYDDVVDLAETIGAPLITTEGLGHRKILRDPETVRTIVEFVTGARDRAASA
ncbi:MAG TPA: alpha/beta fold hydrolase [Marmoricola sp.]|nr:alpha/beta fold hydrolase [Marmoricola sp.]